MVSMGAPVEVTVPSARTVRAAPPSAAVAGGWHAASRPDDAPPPGVVPVTFHAVEAEADVPAGIRWEGAPAPTAGPEPVRGQPSGAKKADDKKADAELPAPHVLVPEGTAVRVVPHIAGLTAPRELEKRALPPYQIGPPDILLVEAVPREGPLKNDQQIRGQHLVGPDGMITLGIYGSVFVGGLTIDQAREAIAAQIRKRVPNFDIRDLNVDMLAYNSQFYYVITDGGGYGEQLYPFPITGSETVLDALGRINGLPPVADKRKVWVARRGPAGTNKVLPVDWCGITQRGDVDTNWQLMPGDRIYVKADHWISSDAWIAKRLSPIERLFGATLLGSETVNSIRNRTGTSGGTP
jgi:polysaccharide export outer membrane protein